MIYEPKNWTPEKEQRYQEILADWKGGLTKLDKLVMLKRQLKQLHNRMEELKEQIQKYEN